VPQVRNTIEDG